MTQTKQRPMRIILSISSRKNQILVSIFTLVIFSFSCTGNGPKMENSDKKELIVKPVEEPNNILYHDSSFDIIDSLIKLENYNVLMISLLKDGNKLCEVSGPELRHYLEPIINYSMVKDSFYYSR